MNKRPGRGKRKRGPEEAQQWLIENKGAFSDWPEINALKDQFGFHVTGKAKGLKGREEVPFGSYIFGFLVGGFLGALLAGSLSDNGAGIGFFVGGVLTLSMLMRRGTEKIDVIITPERIGVGRKRGYEWVDRKFGAAFEVVRPHSRARAEEEAIARAQAKNRSSKFRERIYGKSDEVILNTGVRRLVVAEIYDDERRSEALHMTLFLLNQAVN